MKKPIRLTKELIQELATYIENGNLAKDACMLANVSDSGYYKWLAIGHDVNEGLLPATKANRLCVELVEAIKYADAKFKAYHLANINKAGKVTWQASAWMLERRFYDTYGRKVEQDVNMNVQEPTEGVRIYIPNNSRDGVVPDGD